MEEMSLKCIYRNGDARPPWQETQAQAQTFRCPCAVETRCRDFRITKLLRNIHGRDWGCLGFYLVYGACFQWPREIEG